MLADVRSGYVSVEAARRDYGVAITQSGRKFELDIEATVVMRRARGGNCKFQITDSRLLEGILAEVFCMRRIGIWNLEC